MSISRFYCIIALFGTLQAGAASPTSFLVPVGEQSIRIAIPPGFANAAELGPGLLSYAQGLLGSSGNILGLLLTPADIGDVRLGRKLSLKEFLSVTSDSEWSSRDMTHAQFATELAYLAAQLARSGGADSTSTDIHEGTLIDRFSIKSNCEGFLMSYRAVGLLGSARSAIQGIAIMRVRGKLLFLQVTRLQDSQSATERTRQQLISWAKDVANLNSQEQPTL